MQGPMLTVRVCIGATDALKRVRNSASAFFRGLIVSSAIVLQPAMALGVADVYGIWQGTWFVDEWFDNTGAPLSLPPSPHAAIEFRLHAFDSSASSYGDVFIEGAISGIVTKLDVTGNQIAMEITYPLMGIAEPRGFLNGLHDGGWLRGSFDEQPPVPLGWVGWRGPFELRLTSAVPELPQLWLLSIGMLGLALMKRQSRFSGTPSAQV